APTFTGVQTMTSPALTTPTITTSLLFANGQGFYDTAANTTELYNSTSAQTFRIYNTRTDASNYERFEIKWASNECQVSTGKAGTGTARVLDVYYGDGSGQKAIRIPTATTASLTLGGSVGTSTNASGVVTVPVHCSATSGTHVGMNINPNATPSSTSTLVFRPVSIAPTINYSAGTPGA